LKFYFNERDVEEALDRTLIQLQMHRDPNKKLEYNIPMIPIDAEFYADMDPDNDNMIHEVRKRF